jgi:hypothetical protein
MNALFGTTNEHRLTRMFKTLAVLLIGLHLCSSVAHASVDHSAFDAIAKDVVADERVDYQKVKAQHAAHLQQYLDAMATVDVTALPKDEHLAYYINLYNATMMKAVVDRNHATFKPSDNDFAVFKEPLVRLKGETVSLNDLENEIIRKQFNDPRVHAALNCAAVSCPPIIDRAYRAEDLDQVLDENVKKWLSDPNRNKIDKKSKKLRLSKIFDWYAADFGGKDKVAAWVAEKTGDPAVAKFQVEYIEYDWTLNKKS